MKRRIINASENVRGARGGLSHTSPRNFNLQEPSGAEYGNFMTESRWKTWTDAYALLSEAAHKIDFMKPHAEELAEAAARKVYNQHKGNPLMEEAYRRWCDGSLEEFPTRNPLNWKSWNDAYRLFMDAIEDVHNPDKIEQSVRKIYEQYKGNPLMEEAYRRWLDGGEPVEASASVNTQPLQKFVQVNEKFVQLSDDDFYKAIRMHLSDYNQLPEEVHELFGDYGITRGEDDEGYIYIDIEDRMQDATPQAIALLKKHDICADSKKYQVILYTEIW